MATTWQQTTTFERGFSVVHQTLIFTMEEQNFRKSPQITQVKLMPYVTGCAHLSWNQSLSSCFGNAIPGLAVIGTGNRQAEPSTLFNFSQIKLRYFLDIIKRVATVPVLIHIQKAPSKWRAHTSKAIVDSALFLVLPLLLIRSVPRIFKPSLT